MKFAKHYCQHCYHAGDEPCPVHGRREMAPEEINKAVAERVMGWTIQDSRQLYYYEPAMLITDFNPAERIDHAWMVVEKMKDKYHWVIKSPFEKGDTYMAGLTPLGVTGWNGRPDFMGQADTAPMAICLAALEAVGGEIC